MAGIDNKWLNGFNLSNPQDGESIVYDGTTGKMVNRSLPNIFNRQIRAWIAAGNGNTVTAIGANALTTTGAGTNYTVNPASRKRQTPRVGRITGAAPVTATSVRASTALNFLSNTPGLGGFEFRTLFAFDTNPPERMFFGMLGQTGAIGNIEPNTLLNSIGICKISTDSQIFICHNDNAGIATLIPLGAGFESVDSTIDGALYELSIVVPTGQAVATVTLGKVGTNQSASAQITTDLPLINTLLAPHQWIINTNGISSAMSFSKIIIISDE